MRYRTTVFLLIVAAGLFAWIYFGELRRHESVESAELFPGYSADSINEISIVANEQTLRLVRDARSRWSLAEPFAYPADQVLVEQLLSTIPVLPAARVDTGNLTWQVLEAFGLNPPKIEVTLTGGGATHVLAVGNSTPKENRFYFSVNSVPGVYLVPDAFANYVGSPVDFWRDRTFVDLDFDEVTTLKVARESQGFSLSRSGQLPTQWKLLPLDVPADGLTIELLLSALGHAQVNAFVPPSEVDLLAMGLNAPALSLEFLRSTNRMLKVDFGVSPEDGPEFVYARHSAGTNVFLVSAEISSAFRMPSVDFRERQLLSFKPEEIGRIDFGSDGGTPFNVARDADGVWRLGGPVDAPADEELVTQLLQELLALKIRRFDKDVVTDFATYALASPRRTIELRGPAGGDPAAAPIASLAVGTNNAAAIELVHVRANGGKSVASVDLAAVTELPGAPYALRDRDIWSFNTNSVVSVHVKDRGAEWTVLRRAANDWEVAPPFGGFANPFEVEAGVAQLSDLDAVRWRSNDPRYANIYGFPERRFEVTIKTLAAGSEETFTIAFGARRSPNGNSYAMVELSGEEIFFEVSGQTFELIEKYLAVPQPAPETAASDTTPAAE